jgi:hypothetical protein
MIRRFSHWADHHPRISIPAAILLAAIVSYYAIQADRTESQAIRWEMACDRSVT